MIEKQLELLGELITLVDDLIERVPPGPRDKLSEFERDVLDISVRIGNKVKRLKESLSHPDE